MPGKRFRRALVSLLLVAIVACGTQEPEAITIGGYSLEESRTLVEVARQVLIAEGYVVTPKEYTSRRDLMAALDKGEVDLVAEYLASLLAHYEHPHAGTRAESLEDLAESREGMLVAIAPAHAGRGLVVRAEFAGEHGVRSIAGLSGVIGRMVIGGPAGCPASPTCLLGLETVYGYVFEGFTPIDEADVLAAALAVGQVDAAVLFVTDPVIADRDLVVLEDDLGMQGREHPILLQRPGLLGGQAILALESVLATLDTDRLRELNARVAQRGREAAVVELLGGES